MQLRALTQKPLLVALVALTIAAWLSLFALEQSPYGHQLVGHAGAAGHDSSVSPTSAPDSGLLTLAFFTATWAVMVVAMMLPTMLPQAMHFSRSIVQLGGRARSVFLLLGGYVLAWTIF